MKLIGIVLVLVSVGAMAQDLVPCSIYIDTDYLRNDIRYEFVNDAQGCQTLCANEAQCVGWTYVVTTRACWLKNKIEPALKVPSPGRVFGTKCTTTGTTSAGQSTASVTPPPTGIFTTTVSGASTVTTSGSGGSRNCFVEFGVEYKIASLGSMNATKSDECCTACRNNDKCKAWTYYLDAKLCTFLDYVPSSQLQQRPSNPNAVSAVMNP